MKELPSGTVTFLFTDIEGSTKLWEKHPEEMKAALAKHDGILKNAVESNHGHIIKTTGDGVHAVFEKANDAVKTTIHAQQELNSSFIFHNSSLPLKARMGLHTGEAELRDGDYYGSVLNRTARLMSAANSGQILLSNTTAELVREQLPADTTLHDLGEHRLKDLTRPEHVFQINHPNLPSEFPPIKSLDSFPHNIPIQLTSFVGREKEIDEITELLKTSRLVTLTGSGGTGKTRLSIEVGAQELESFSNGVWLIELAPLSDESQIIPALAQAFGLQELPFNPLANLVNDYLRDKKLLLILDNCEHLIAACARLADNLLHHCAGLKILASSREALGIAGEAAYRTPSLADSESTRLFVDRARAANSKFSLSDSNASSVAQICHRLDGIPLAIELAAARTKLLSVDQISARLDDLFRLLVGGSRTALPRQQTLRALIDWSYDLLSDEEKNLLRIASVFVGGWTLDALEAVSEDPNTLEHLEGLVNKSLIVTEEHESEMRYFLLETIRQYAREKLFEAKQSSTARDRHFIYFDELSEKMWDDLRSATFLPIRNRAFDEIENLRTALEWGMDHHVESAVHLAANFCIATSWFGMQTEGRTLLNSALEQIETLPPPIGDAHLHRQKLIAKGLFAEGMVAVGQGDSLRAAQVLQKAADISRLTGDKLILGYSLEMYFIAAEFVKMPGGPEAVDDGLIILTELGDTWGIFMANLNKARVATFRGNSDDRQIYLKKNRELMMNAPLSFQSAIFYLGMGMDERYRGNHQAARPYFEEGLKAFQKLRHKNFENVMRSELGHITRLSGDLTQAREIYQQTIKRWQDLGHRSAIANQLESFAFISIAEEEPQLAAKLFGAAEALREKIGSPMAKYEEGEYNQSVTQLRAMLQEAEFNALWAEGRSMTMEQAIQLALE
jgi:predicted ATPase/class 3 adenylate cyclase